MANPDFTGILSSDRSSFEGELPGSIHFGIQGPPGPPGKDGTVAFEDLTAEQIESLRGRPGPSGKTAYEYAKDGGYAGSETDFAAKLATEYLPLSGGDMTGAINMNGQPISGLNLPTANDQAANMGFVNQQVRKAAPRNLLDNSDFRNPVNHRGLTSYIGDGYTIDRWASLNTNNIITVLDGGIRFQTTGAGVFRQSLDVGNKYVGKKLTLAMKTIDGTIHCCSGTMVDAVDATFVARSATEGIRVELYGMNNSVMVQFFDTDGDVTIEWATLYEGEYTLDTLPEYQSKGYGAELAECQRYLQRFRTETERKTYCEDFRPTMHLTPNGVVSKFEQNIDGVTHYFASAEP